MSIPPGFSNVAERILLTLWVGGMWMAGYVVTPVLFQVLDDRQLAGMIAGHVFTANSYIGITCGGLLLVSSFVKGTGNRLKDSRIWILVVMLIIILIVQFIFQPMMAELKVSGLSEGGKEAAEFSRLHGMASMLFLVNSILGLVLVGSGKFWNT